MTNSPNMDAFFMPFTSNRLFKKDPRIITSAKGMYFYDPDGRPVLDGTAGLWCCGLGHGREEIAEAVGKQLLELDFSPCFQFAHPKVFEVAQRLSNLFPGSLNRAFFTNSGSESVDSALKIALAYHQAKGNSGKTMFIGREKGYHGTNFGGTSVGGIAPNRMFYGNLLPRVAHMRSTLLPENIFSKGQPEHGDWLADDLERFVVLHGAQNIAAVIVEPMVGSAGVYPPPKGYLERLRAICTKHDILLIFDEVITAFGRLGRASASEHFGITPDLVTTAKGLTNGVLPMGAVMVDDSIYDAIINNSKLPIELFHGYTYSGHPVACAAAIASLDIYEKENLYTRANDLAPYLEEKVHSLKDLEHITDTRNLGLVAAFDLSQREGAPGARGFEVMLKAWEKGVMLRVTADTIAISPPLIVNKEEIDTIFSVAREAIESVQ